VPEVCPKGIVLFENRFDLPRLMRCAVRACVLPLVATAALAQSPAPGTSSSQSGTTAAPGTAPMQSRTVAQALAPTKVTTYDERWDLFAGLSFMNGQAGQNLPKRYNMGGGEVMGTYWLTPKVGVTGDYRFEAGDTDLLQQAPLANTRAAIFHNIVSGGASYRLAKNRYAAVELHALVGADHGKYDHSIKNDVDILPGSQASDPAYFGLYENSTTPWGAAGGSLDFNMTPRLAVRLSPDIIFEHFGTETREFFSLGGGVMYRFGKRR
jgi:hypothetical protein